MATTNELVKKVLNHINEKINSVGGVVDKWSDGNGNWWRKYSDGFIVQGGTEPYTAKSGVVTFHIPFSTANCVVVAPTAEVTSTDSDGVDMATMVSDFTASSFRYSRSSGRTVPWVAYGY